MEWGSPLQLGSCKLPHERRNNKLSLKILEANLCQLTTPAIFFNSTLFFYKFELFSFLQEPVCVSFFLFSYFLISGYKDSSPPKKGRSEKGSLAMTTRDRTRQNTSHHFITWKYSTKRSTNGPLSLKYATRKEIA